MIRLVEEMVLNPAALGESMQGYRQFRIEYPGGREGVVWLPPAADRDAVEDAINAKDERKATDGHTKKEGLGG